MRFTSQARSRLVRSGIAAAAVAALSTGLLLAPEDAHAVSPNQDKNVILAVGSNATQRMLSWYSATGDAQQIVFGPSSTFGAGTGTTTVNVTPVANAQGATTWFNARGTLTGLTPNTAYSYKVGSDDGGWSQTFTFKTYAADFATGFSADFFGDPQIGASGSNTQDGDGWVQTIKLAQAHDTDAELYLSGGDQIDTGSATDTIGAIGTNKLEDQWDNFLRPFTRGSTAYNDNMTGDQVPWAPTIGNHDVSTKTYMQHLAQPNLSDDTRFYANAASQATTSGGNYWFTYRGVLFIDLNSNSYNPTPTTTPAGDPAHVAYVRNVIGAHGADAKYTVLLYHHSIYSPADHANDVDNSVRRNDFPQVFSQLGVDLVLQGHDHSYSRSYALKSGDRGGSSRLVNGQWVPETSDAAGNPSGTTILPGPGGVIYVTANSASGSKYYDLTDPGVPDATHVGPDSTETTAQAQSNHAVVGGHTNHWANATENQEHVPSYVQVTFGTDKISVTDVRSGDCATTSPNPAVTRGKVDWCGDVANTWAGAVVEGVNGVPADQNGNLVNGDQITAATPTSTGTNDAWNLAHPKGGLIDAFTIQQFVGPSAVAVSGNPVVGQTLSASLTGGFTTGTEVSYSWKADGVPFSSAAAPVLTADQAGKKITVRVTGTLAAYEPLSVSSAATATVTTPPAPPVPGTLMSAVPTIEGKAKVGKTLTAVTGSWTPGTSFSFTWYANGKQVGTGQTLALTKKLKNKKITVSVTGSLSGYTSATQISAPTAKVAFKK